jgi:hypothetical protein
MAEPLFNTLQQRRSVLNQVFHGTAALEIVAHITQLKCLRCLASLQGHMSRCLGAATVVAVAVKKWNDGHSDILGGRLATFNNEVPYRQTVAYEYIMCNSLAVCISGRGMAQNALF